MDSCENEDEDENNIIDEDEAEEDITDDLLIMQMLGML